MSQLLEVTLSSRTVLRLDTGNMGACIQADPTQLRQIVMNLITNASDAIGEKSGMITIRTGIVELDRNYLNDLTIVADNCEEGFYSYLEVSDTGSGMSEESIAHMFEPFFSTKNEGHGLGLAATLGVVQSHTGALKVYSEVGKVLFPHYDSEESELKSRKNCGFSGQALVVDDNEHIRAVTKRVLEKSGFDVTTAEDGLVALQLIKANAKEFNVAIIDLIMPRMGGRELISEIRKINDHIPLILTSGYNENEAVSELSGKKLSGFIQKPWSSDELLKLVGDLTDIN